MKHPDCNQRVTLTSQVLFVFVLAMLMLPMSWAQSGFEAEVAVNGQAEDEQVSAYRVAMRIILLRNSGDKSLLNQPAIQRALIEANNYVDENSYRVPGPQDRMTRATPLTAKVRQSNEATHLLRIRFNQALITGLITDQSEPVELDPDAEPEVPQSALIWLLIDDGNGEHRIGASTGQNVIDRAMEIAGGIGQRLKFPSQDEQDQLALSVQDMQAGNQQRVIAASQRYNEPVALVGLLKRSAERSWITSWSRYFSGSTQDFNGEAASLDQALQQGLNWLASTTQPVNPDARGSHAGSNQFSNQSNLSFGNSTGGFAQNSNNALIWVSRLVSVEGYAALMKVMEDTESVELVFPAEMSPAGMLFAVSPRFALNDVTQRLTSLSWLRNGAAFNQGDGGVSAADAHFEFVR